jgi:hypothetical protein
LVEHGGAAEGTSTELVTRQEVVAQDITAIIGVGGGLALIALAIGAGVVARGERNSLRPSGLARLSAGAGVMTLGCSGGLLLALLVMTHGLGKAEQSATPASVPEQAKDFLTGPSVVVLTVMLGLLVVGLGWCFYRSLKATGDRGEIEQTPEGAEG